VTWPIFLEGSIDVMNFSEVCLQHKSDTVSIKLCCAVVVFTGSPPSFHQKFICCRLEALGFLLAGKIKTDLGRLRTNTH